MFTGIIEEVGYIKNILKTSQGARFTVSVSFAGDVKLGDSVAINGICSTVVSKTNDTIDVEYSNHTLNITNLNTIKQNSSVNLERALKITDRLDGHFVTGHVDAVTKLISIEDEGFSKKISFEIPSGLSNQIVKKGSITIDGISLTVSDLSDTFFSVTIIPHTLSNTTLITKKVGDFVNIETDILGKYVEKILVLKNNTHTKSNITEEFLIEKGFF